MSATGNRKDHPLSMRLPDADLALIDRAAALRGRSRTDFVREAAVRAAEDALMEAGLVRMSEDGFAEFMAVLSAPEAPVAPMVEILRRPAPWEAERGQD
ncbi:MAG TPA: DUF1778 domain-containing protein [Stellaceae bacterium]|jgi:uncharacterized protein (DUF1778 family)